jgi:hypothetical protein
MLRREAEAYARAAQVHHDAVKVHAQHLQEHER